ncbi:MAG TPA: hypothetical protein VMS31_02390, partial [Pyrinomonadaceae bacterium]|nr:hypothetical protein [Pyrinomonadaceae bacterium]
FGYPGMATIHTDNRNAVATTVPGPDATALRLKNSLPLVPRVAAAATLGFETKPLRGRQGYKVSNQTLSISAYLRKVRLRHYQFCYSLPGQFDRSFRSGNM